MSTGGSYDNLGRKLCCGGIKGLRLNSRRFSVQRLRTNFIFIFRLLRRWRNSYKNCLRMLRRSLVRGRRRRKQPCSVGGDVSYRFSSSTTTSYSAVRTMNHSNSFCSEAIADCVEFIKRNSVSSIDDERNPMLEHDN